MKFHEKLLELRKQRGLSQEELGQELEVSRQTISKWESGQSYPDFQRLVLLSDYFDMTLDELVRGIDVQEVRDRSRSDEKIASLYTDVEKVKEFGHLAVRIVTVLGVAVLVCIALALVLRLVRGY